MAQPVGAPGESARPNRAPGSVPARTFPAPLQGGVQKWPHDAGGYPGRNFARASGRVGPKQRKKKVEGYPSSYRSVVQQNRLLGEMKYGHSLVLWAASGGRNRLPAPKGPRWTSVRLREHEDGPAATSRGSPRLAAYREGRAMSPCRPRRDVQARRACLSCTRR